MHLIKYKIWCLKSILCNEAVFQLSISFSFKDDFKMIMDYYTEAGNYADESVIWLGKPTPSAALPKAIKVYDDFDSIGDNLKRILFEVNV